MDIEGIISREVLESLLEEVLKRASKIVQQVCWFVTLIVIFKYHQWVGGYKIGLLHAAVPEWNI